MKINIIKVLNEIAAADATIVLLNDPDAVWNLPNNDEDLRIILNMTMRIRGI